MARCIAKRERMTNEGKARGKTIDEEWEFIFMILIINNEDTKEAFGSLLRAEVKFETKSEGVLGKEGRDEII